MILAYDHTARIFCADQRARISTISTPESEPEPEQTEMATDQSAEAAQFELREGIEMVPGTVQLVDSMCSADLREQCALVLSRIRLLFDTAANTEKCRAAQA